MEFIKDNWQILTTLVAALGYMYRQIIATRRGIKIISKEHKPHM